MAEEIHIRTVTVELLRAGPSHNQLLSPLTQYLGICDDAEAGIVMLPYEQHTFERRMRAMRYDGEMDKEKRAAQKDKLPDLRDLGVEMAKLLGAVPRLPGSLAADPRGQDTLVHLSLVLSASELAGLPFELAKVPIGPNAWTESWLALQARVPVVITRRTRNVSTPRLNWLECPRILFVAANPDEDAEPAIPFQAHRQALIDAVRPFLMPEELDGGRHSLEPAPKKGPADTAGPVPENQIERFGDLLTILSNASFDAVVRECAATPYTHVHLLAHGSTDDAFGDTTHGLVLNERDGVISGDRLASALACMVDGRLHRPQLVTLATCDSGSMDDPVNPGAGIAHVLHQAGVPLVVASQVPLGFAGSVLLAREFYSGLLWGEHPWKLLHRVRSSLHGRLDPRRHDWASLVVYESLPSEMNRQLEAARFRQCKQALNVAFERSRYGPFPEADGEPCGDAWDPDKPIEDVIAKLPMKGQYFGMEALALRADGRMLIARNLFDDSLKAEDAPSRRELALLSRWRLEQALVDYAEAVDGFLVSPGQGMNAPYRTLVAQLSIKLVLGEAGGFDPDMWHTAKYWVDRTIDAATDPDDKVWAWGCLAELWLLHLLDQETPLAVRMQHAAQARLALREMLRVSDRTDADGGTATSWVADRLDSYASWWGHPEFESAIFDGREGRESFSRGEAPCVNAMASEMAAMLSDKFKPNGLAMDSPPPEPLPEEARAAPAPAKPAPAAKAGKPAKAAQVMPAAAATNNASAILGARKPAATAPAQALTGATFTIEMLAAGPGDTLWIEYGLPGKPLRRILIDCGTAGTYAQALKPRLERLAATERHFELFVMTHIDSDHIAGGIPLLKDAPALGLSFGDLWFNGRKHLQPDLMAVSHGDEFSKQIRAGKLPWNAWRGGKAIVRGDDALPSCELADGFKLTLLSPMKEQLLALADQWDAELGPPKPEDLMRAAVAETGPPDIAALAALPFGKDPSKPNGSSIGLLAEFQGKRVLLGADVYAPVLEGALKLLGAERSPLHLDAFKLSHHGSKNNLRKQVLDLVDCRHYLVSTNGQSHQHPDRQAIAQVIAFSRQPPTLHFNYRSKYNEVWGDPALQAKNHGYQTVYPEREPGLVFRLL
ncbi:hypothetical protein BurJ1DRAFT_3475 [Burkholderiales bacterium JOSHI_001]|nr:hypothetical protein BurJ1DRAFT_3475 [Burkholderiales bacterium JOSHI_001]